MSQTVLEKTVGGASPMPAHSGSDQCARIKDLSFTASKHIRMYGERFEIVSDPFAEGGCIAVRAIAENHLDGHPDGLQPYAPCGFQPHFSSAKVLTIDQSY